MPATRWRLADRTLEFGRRTAATERSSPHELPIGAGIVNVTVDSMFEGARSGTPEQAVADGERLVAEGFEMIDVGAVAARSGPPVAAADEIARLVPAVEGLVASVGGAGNPQGVPGVPISADTFEPEVAKAAAAAGAAVINDIGGGPDAMLEVVAESGCGYVLMHIEGPPRVDRPKPSYVDVVARLLEFFGERIDRAVELGVDPEAIAIDPGPDFDLSTADDLEILARLDELHALGRPIYMSLSRKDFIGEVLAGSWEKRLGASERGNGTIAAATLAALVGAQVHRLHDREALDAIRVAASIAAVS